MGKAVSLFVVALLLAATAASGQSFKCEEEFRLTDEMTAPYRQGPEAPPPPPPPPPVVETPQPPQPPQSSFADRLVKYAQLSLRHKLTGLASYYSGFFDGRKTANGEIFRNGRYSAAHLTLPLGCWIEVTSRATGRKLRLRVNDRGPYAKKFTLDLSQAAARYLGVDRHPDRRVDIRVIALPGEEPLPEELDVAEESLRVFEAQSRREGTTTASNAQ